MPQRDDRISSIEGSEEKFITGKVQISTLPAEDIDSHGTEITLLDIRPFVRESLQSSTLWTSIDPEPGEELEEDLATDSVNLLPVSDEDEFVERPPVPEFHIGRVSEVIGLRPQGV